MLKKMTEYIMHLVFADSRAKAKKLKELFNVNAIT